MKLHLASIAAFCWLAATSAGASALLVDKTYRGDGHWIEPGSWHSYRVPSGDRVYGCSISVSMSAVANNNTRVLAVARSAEAGSFFSVKLGRVVVDLGRSAVRIVQLDSDETVIEKTIATVSVWLFESSQFVEAEIAVIDRIVTVSAHGAVLVQGSVDACYFNQVSIGASEETFFLHHLMMTAVRKDSLTIPASKEFVDIAARYQPSAFARSDGMPHHHLVACNEGAAGPHALFSALVSAEKFRTALVQIGLHSGENLTNETWTRRADKTSSHSSRRMIGDSVRVSICFRGTWLPLASVIVDESGASADLRFGGSAKLIRHFRSGCLVCLESCPAAVVGNARYSMHDWSAGTARFSSAASIVQEGDVVTLRFARSRP
jgi:hypothetical protein